MLSVLASKPAGADCLSQQLTFRRQDSLGSKEPAWSGLLSILYSKNIVHCSLILLLYEISRLKDLPLIESVHWARRWYYTYTLPVQRAVPAPVPKKTSC